MITEFELSARKEDDGVMFTMKCYRADLDMPLYTCRYVLDITFLVSLFWQDWGWSELCAFLGVLHDDAEHYTP